MDRATEACAVQQMEGERRADADADVDEDELRVGWKCVCQRRSGEAHTALHTLTLSLPHFWVAAGGAGTIWLACL